MIAVVVLAAASWTVVAGTARISSLEKDVRILQDRVRRLSYNSASGGGINLKMMPDTKTGAPTVPLEEVFSFDRNHALCRVDSNPQGFTLPTYSRGNLVVEPHRFFMSMAATSIDQYEVSTRADGKRQVRMRGGLSCATEIGQATVTLGSRTAAEHASYLIEAVDGGIGGGRAGDSFAFTVFFDPRDAPVNYSLFGPKFTFTGRMVEGEITIVDTHIP
ncbi:MAG TPA: hypothetical protein VFW01_00730 [bacterium]|nr:hypothetical protein [bacterium]